MDAEVTNTDSALHAKKGMSTGAKAAIATAVVFALLACCGVLAVFVAVDAGRTPSFGDRIALIHVDGVIAGTGSYYDGVITPEAVIDQLDQALADDSVKAILLRIDSPGGTVAASQEISLAVRRAAESKPVIASIGDIGASGAYMVAAQCERIIAAPGSSVGSIGVILEIPNLAGLMDKLGVEFTVLTQGEHKDVGSPFRSVTPTETEMLDEQMKVAYEQFIDDVSLGRGLSPDKVRELATGWVWMGTEAKALGLVDEIGNYSDAVDAAAELGGIEGEPTVVEYYQEYGLTDLIWSLFSLDSRLGGPDAESVRRTALPR